MQYEVVVTTLADNAQYQRFYGPYITREQAAHQRKQIEQGNADLPPGTVVQVEIRMLRPPLRPHIRY